MRMELINLPFSNVYYRRLDPPLFLLQLAPELLGQGFKIRVNDLNGLDRKQWCFGKCLIYILYIDAKRFNLSKKIVQQCKQMNENALIVACGSGPSKNAARYMGDSDFDVIIRGEPEAAIKRFMHDYVNKGGEVSKVYRKEVYNINRLPLPSRYLVDMNSYYRRLGTAKAAMILGSRGSPYRSTWMCEGHKAFGVKRIMNEIISIHSAHGINAFFFGDEAFCFDKHRAIALGEFMKDKGFSFGFNDIISNVDIELYRRLSDLGCKEVILNLFGEKSASFINSMSSKIEEDTGIRVILKHDAKYASKGKARKGNSSCHSKPKDKPS